MDGAVGNDPTITGSKPDALPLGYTPIKWQLQRVLTSRFYCERVATYPLVDGAIIWWVSRESNPTRFNVTRLQLASTNQ